MANPRSYFPSAAASSSPAASSTSQPQRAISDWDELSAALPPTKSQLHALSALPVGMLNKTSKKLGGKKKKGGKLAKDGQIVSIFYDAFGRRPSPTNGISLEQQVTVELEVLLTQNWLTSSVTAGVPTYASAYFVVSTFAGATSLLAVFDQYKIEQVETWIEFQAPNGTSAMPDLVSAVDLDDANTPTSLGQVQDHQGAVMGVGPGGQYHKWKPHMAVAAFSGAFTSYSNEVSGWIDSASPNVQHFGVKAAMISNGGVFATNLVVRAVVSFRAPCIN